MTSKLDFVFFKTKKKQKNIDFWATSFFRKAFFDKVKVE
jgi:hypothetical protein